MRKAFALIAKGLIEKEQLLQKEPTRYPYSKALQHGINMFLAASQRAGSQVAVKYPDEAAFLAYFITRPIEEWFDTWESGVVEQLHLQEEPFYAYDAFAYQKAGNAYVPSSDCYEFLETQDSDKCLVDFEINFVTNDCGSSTILIGENGTGKSTMLESILEILMSFDSDAIEKKISYDYEFEYFYGGNNISIYQRDKTYQINIDGEIFCLGKMDTVRKHIAERTIFPKRINYFYSGASNKVLLSIKRGNINYGTKCRSAVMQYWRAAVWANHEYQGEFPKRKYNYCADSLTSIYLISILAGQRTFEKQF